MLSVFVGGSQLWTTPRPLVLTTLRRSRRRAVGRRRAVHFRSSFPCNGSRHGGSGEQALLRAAPLLSMRENRHFSSQNVRPCSVMSPLRTPRGLLSRWLAPASQTAPSRTPISDSDFRLPTRTGLGLRPPSRIRISDSDLGLGARTSDYRVPSDGCPFAVGALLLVAPSDRRARHTSGSLHGPTAPPCDVHCTASDEARMA
jgi:hypothetical protein